MTCAACDSPDRDDIDVRLASGDSPKVIALRFGVSQEILKYHHAEHVGKLAVRVRSNPTSVLVDLERVERDAWTLVQMGKGMKAPDSEDWLIKPNAKILQSGLQEVRATKLAMVKLARELAVFRKDMIPRDTFNRMMDAVLKALEAHPDAHAAVDNAMAEFRA